MELAESAEAAGAGGGGVGGGRGAATSVSLGLSQIIAFSRPLNETWHLPGSGHAVLPFPGVNR